MRPGRIYQGHGQLEESSLNRSPHSYLNNPEEERQRCAEEDTLVSFLLLRACGLNTHVLLLSVHRGLRYKWNTDKDVTVLKFTDLDGDGIGMLRLTSLLQTEPRK